MRFAFVFIPLLLLLSCQPRSVARIDPNTTVDLSGRWNDSDSRAVADKMIHDLLNSDQFKAYSTALGHKPVIIVGEIMNRTSEHIDSEGFIKRLEVDIYQSGIADMVESDALRDKIRKERLEQQDFADPATIASWGKETGANVMLFGEMLSETDTYNNKRVVNYTTTLYLTDMETNKRVWYGQEEIKKFVKG